MSKYFCQLNLTELDLLVIYEMLWNTKLGNSNKFEKSISSMFIDAENEGMEEVIKRLTEKHGRPELGVLADRNGIVLTID